VHSKGVKRSLKEVEAKEVEGDMDVTKNKKNMPMVDVWTGADGCVETQNIVKLENSAHAALLSEKERLRLSIDQASYTCVC
jgi:uncharacterized protein (UPF0371 family)